MGQHHYMFLLQCEGKKKGWTELPPDQLCPMAVSAHMPDHTSPWDSACVEEEGKADNVDIAVLDVRHSTD